jgi:hypothetical protein
MSVTLRYSGALADKNSLAKLSEDFRDIAATHAWPVDALEPAPPEAVAKQRGRGARTLARPMTLQGLKIYIHPQTDPLWLTFDAEGVLTRLGTFPLTQVDREGGNASSRFGFLHQSQASMQTSIGGQQLHSTVISLLDYLKKAYIPGLHVDDETGFWEHRDLEELKRLMAGL